MSRKVTIVNYYGSQDDSRCGYCSTVNTSQSHGMWAHCMTVHDYQDLIDRGWRRSGQYCYKPNNRATCCPSYTIKCDAKVFNLSKSHKKILKKMNNFLRTGKNNTNKTEMVESNDDINGSQIDAMQSESEESSALTETQLITSIQPEFPIDLSKIVGLIDKSNAVSATQSEIIGSTSMESKKSIECKKNFGPDPSKPLRQKAKFLRAQRKLEKQLLRSGSSNEVLGVSEVDAKLHEKLKSSTEQTLQSLLDTMPTDGQHKLQVKLIPSSSASTEAELNLYRQYQVGIHNDPPEKVTRKSFESFLVRSPLQHETSVNGPHCGYGSFHQQYWLDGKLIAVGVIDILPKCISSVYFFYDPEYSFLTLGTYGTLREIQFTRELNEKCEHLSEYYMGFYIHSCSKMRYKGRLQPSYLLCPETYTWHLINDDLLKLLDDSKYSRLNPDSLAKDINEFTPATDLDNLQLLVDYKFCLTYKGYREYKRNEGNDSDDEDYENFSEYGKLLGTSLSHRIYLVT